MSIRILSRRNRRSGMNSLLGIGTLSIALVVSAAIIKYPNTPVDEESPPVPIVAEFDAIKVSVPADPVPAGTRVKEIKFVTVSFPKHQLPQGAILDPSPMVDAVTTAALPARLPLFKENLSFNPYSKNPVIERIPAGMRAMTIKVDATTAVEGWAGSGSLVDVILIEQDKSSVVAEKVKILSTERSVSPVEGGVAPSVPSTVTLLVSQEQCLAINTALQRGKIAFALRSTNDQEPWGDTVFTAERLSSGSIAQKPTEPVSGYAALGSFNEKNGNAFALSGGKWIRTEVIPEGFFVSRKE